MHIRITCNQRPGSGIMFNPEVDKRGAPKITDRPDREIAQEKLFRQDGRYGFPIKMLWGALIAAGRFVKNGKSLLTTAERTLVPSIIQRIEDSFIFFLEHSDWEVNVDFTYNKNRERLRTVRPRFEKWSFVATLEVSDDAQPEVVLALCQIAGSKVGLGSFSISHRGTCGAFEVVKFEVIKVTDNEIDTKKVQIEFVDSFERSKLKSAVARS